MDLLIPIVAALAAACIAVVVMRSAAARQLAEARAAAGAELAAAQQALFDKADQRLRDQHRALRRRRLVLRDRNGRRQQDRYSNCRGSHDALLAWVIRLDPNLTGRRAKT